MVNVARYIDILTDYSFKRIFGAEPNKDLLIDFLNEVFRGRKHIVDLVYNKNEHPGDTVEEGTVVFDLLCTGLDGERFLIEVQRGKPKNFKERALFYTSRLISEQAPRGKREEWGYNITDIYFIALLEESNVDKGIEEEYIQEISLCNVRTGEVFYEKLSYIYIELAKFEKEADELITELDKWLYLLKHMSSMDKIPDSFKRPNFQKLFNMAEYSLLTKEEKMIYDNSLKRKWDNKAVLDNAIEEGEEKGIEKGIKIGIDKGFNLGKIEEKKEVVIQGLEMGLAIEDISKLTKLSIAQIEELKLISI